MKLSTVALSVVAILGVGLTGASWYTGKLAEEKYVELVEKTNKQLVALKSYELDAQLKDVKLERGIFSSDVTYVLDVKTPEGQAYQFTAQDKLFHGPIPLNRLTQGKLSPVVASLESKISAPESLKANMPNPLSSNLAISYSSAFSGNMSLPLVEFKASNPQGGNMVLRLEELVYDLDNFKLEDAYPNISTGQANLKLKSLQMLYPEEQGSMSFEGIRSKGLTSLEKDRVVSSADFVSEKMLISQGNEKIDLGKFSMDLLMDVDAKRFDNFLGETSNDEAVVLKAMGELFTTDSKLHIKSLSLENAKGKSDLALILNLETFNPDNFKGMADFLTPLQQSLLEVKLDKDNMEELLTQVNKLTPETREQAEILAKQIVAQWLSEATQGGFAVSTDKGIAVKLEVDKGNVKLNGTDIPQEQVETALFMLMLGLGSMGM
ncbi:hypothetical protein A4G20_07800 [Pasteurellaceae bacterium RH1A]|nr:hypothetical protein A4G20_07800 [Pasteurellaceae bacterium RH1A]